MRIEAESTRWIDRAIEQSRFTLEDQPDKAEIERECITLYPQVEYQRFEGFGCAITEACGYVLEQLPQKVSSEILEECFGPSGLAYSWVRTHIDSCDFSLSPYSSCVMEKGSAGIDAESFEAHDGRFLIPWIKRAAGHATDSLRLYLTPWSPPAWMKSNGRRDQGGTLLESFRKPWADYIAQVLKAYERRGLQVSVLGVQNEPNAAQRWDSCQFSASQERSFIEQELLKALKAAALTQMPLITIWDHNRERLFERVQSVCSGEAVNLIGAASYHWYSGDHFDQIALTAAHYPNLLLIFSEGCIEYSEFSSDTQLAHARHYAHQIIGDLEHGTHLWLDWNMALSTDGGPNHAGNLCDSPIMCDLERGTYQKRLSYYYIRHFSRAIRPGSVRIANSCYTEELELTSWKDPEGRIILVLHNRCEGPKQVNLKIAGRLCPFTIEEESIMTLTMTM